MLIHETFRYTGREQRWQVPEGVLGGEVFFECWGATGGLASYHPHRGKRRQTLGGWGPRNDDFTNNPRTQASLGRSFSNNAGYAAGTKKVEEGETYHIYVGGNGGPGYSAIRRRWNDTIYTRVRGGTGGFNGGGVGGVGSRVDRNLYNSTRTKAHYRQNSIPNSASKGQIWLDTDAHKVYRARRKYSGGGSMKFWSLVTDLHVDMIGSSGGGGGGATDIRFGGDGLSNRILVAGGAGGSGGRYTLTGSDAWRLRKCPEAPAPPFGNDDVSTGPTGPDNTWTTGINYLVGGWGRGGLGGAGAPTSGSETTTDGGTATRGGSGGPASNRHREGSRPGYLRGSEGKGGQGLVGGKKGHGGRGGSSGSFGQGGAGADATGRTGRYSDDWASGGGGGGGGYFGGGGGGQGFRVGGFSARTNETRTHGGGGGGGSNYAGPEMSTAFLLGTARPPYAAGGTGATGRGGFARVSYRLPPRTILTSVPPAPVEALPFDISFRYEPAEAGGADIDYYVVGTDIESAEFPTNQTVVNIEAKGQTQFTYSNLVAPAATVKIAVFVKTVDVHGDSSAWAKYVITGAPAPIPATITSPLAGSVFLDSALVTWTLNDPDPLVAYRLGLTGTDLVNPSVRDFPTEWKPGGSRVNLATDPGFAGTAVWSANTADTSIGEVQQPNLAPSADFPGASGSCGKIVWAATEEQDAENHTTPWDTLRTDMTYRFHIEVASGTTDDARNVEFLVEDENGFLASHVVDFTPPDLVTDPTGETPLPYVVGDYVTFDLPFTPTGQGVTLRVRPSAVDTGIVDDPETTEEDESAQLFFGNAEAGQITYLRNFMLEPAFSADPISADSFAVNVDGLVPYAGGVISWTDDGRLEGDVGAAKYVADGTSDGLAQATWTPVHESLAYVARIWAFAETATRSAQLRIVWRDAAQAVILTSSGTTESLTVDGGAEAVYTELTVADTAPAGAVEARVDLVFVGALAAEEFYVDDLTLSPVDSPAYFDGSTGVGYSWEGGANASASLFTGTGVTSDTLTVTDTRLTNGSIYLDTLSDDAIVVGSERVRASVSVSVNEDTAAPPVVTLTIDHSLGTMTLDLDAADGAPWAGPKTVSFDIFRNGVRIATGLTPDPLTRLVSFTDVPAHDESVTYMVRAHDETRGFKDQIDGTVLTVL